MRGLIGFLALWAATSAWAQNPARALENAELAGFQFRLIWPNTGELSPDIYAEIARNPDWANLCDEPTFENGESYADLGRPEQGLLLLGVRLFEDAHDDMAGGLVQITFNGATEYGMGQKYMNVLAYGDSIRWHPVAVLPVQAPIHGVVAQMGMQRIGADDVSLLCPD